MTPELPDWHASLDAVEAAVAARLAELDCYEASFGSAYVGEPTSAATFPAADVGWDPLVRTATATANSVERILADHEVEWTEWLRAYAGWRAGIEQSAGPHF